MLGSALGAVTLMGPAEAGNLDISPDSGRPGDEVTISGACSKDNDAQASITGKAIDNTTADIGQNGTFSVTSNVSYVKPGSYKVSFTCNASGLSGSTTFLVERKKKHYREPDGWAMTGGGGTQGPDVPWTPMGLALMGGAAGIGGFLMIRSKARGRA